MLRTLLFLLIAVPGFVAALFNRFAALLLYCWFAFFRPEGFVWWDISGLRLSLLSGAILLGTCILSGRFPDVSHWISRGALAFLALAAVSLPGASDIGTGLYWLDFLARLIIVCLLAITLVETRWHLAALVAVVAGSFGFHSAKAGLASVLGGGVQFGLGLTGTFADNNGYALGTVLTIPFLWAIGQNVGVILGSYVHPHLNRVLRIGMNLAALLSVYTVVSLFSRGGFLGLLAIALVYLWFHPQRVRLFISALVLAGVAAATVPVPEGYLERLQTIRPEDGQFEDSAASRLHFWKVAVEMAIDRPLGVGLFNYADVYDQYDFLQGRYGRGRAVHSSHFQVLAELGFLGAFVWVGLFGRSTLRLLKIRRWAAAALKEKKDDDTARFYVSMTTACLASMAGFVVGGSFIALALNDLTWFTFAFVACLDRLAAKDGFAAVQKRAARPVAHVVARPTRPRPAAMLRRP